MSPLLTPCPQNSLNVFQCRPYVVVILNFVPSDRGSLFCLFILFQWRRQSSTGGGRPRHDPGDRQCDRQSSRSPFLRNFGLIVFDSERGTSLVFYLPVGLFCLKSDALNDYRNCGSHIFSQKGPRSSHVGHKTLSGFVSFAGRRGGRKRRGVGVGVGDRKKSSPVTSCSSTRLGVCP